MYLYYYYNNYTTFHCCDFMNIINQFVLILTIMYYLYYRPVHTNTFDF